MDAYGRGLRRNQVGSSGILPQHASANAPTVHKKEDLLEHPRHLWHAHHPEHRRPLETAGQCPSPIKDEAGINQPTPTKKNVTHQHQSTEC